MPRPNTPEGREAKRVSQKAWRHLKRTEKKDEEEITMDPIIQEQYNDAPQPVLKSEMDVLLDRIIMLRQHLKELTEKRNTLRPSEIVKTDDIDEIEFGQMVEDEAARTIRLRARYDKAIVEKGLELGRAEEQVEEIKNLKRSIERRIAELKNQHVIDSQLAQVAGARQQSEQQLSMHEATLKDLPTNAQRIIAKRGKRGAERQILKQTQREADLRAVIPELEARLAMLNGDFDLQRKLQKQLEKQRGQFTQQLEKLPTGEEPEEQPKYVEFLQPWGGYREGFYQMVASLSEEVAADLVDAGIVRYIEEQKPTPSETEQPPQNSMI